MINKREESLRWMTTMQEPSRSMDHNNEVTGGDNLLNR